MIKIKLLCGKLWKIKIKTCISEYYEYKYSELVNNLISMNKLEKTDSVLIDILEYINISDK